MKKNNFSSKQILLIHFASFFVSNSVLAGIDLANSNNDTWFQYPLFFWGIGLFFHSIAYLFIKNKN